MTVASVVGATKTFDDTVAVEDVSFTVEEGRVVGLLGRNGAGKTTLLRMLLGLTIPTAGTCTILGQPYGALANAQTRVGVSLEGVGGVAGATVGRDLTIWCRMLGVDRRRIAEVLEIVGLDDVERRKVDDLSTGMRQRHNLAIALLADPGLLVLDEPATGLDPDGIKWLRHTLRGLAAEGRTVLLSSHLLAEVEQTVDDVIILDRRLLYSGSLADLTDGGRVRLEERFFDLRKTSDDPGLDEHSTGRT